MTKILSLAPALLFALPALSAPPAPQPSAEAFEQYEKGEDLLLVAEQDMVKAALRHAAVGGHVGAQVQLAKLCMNSKTGSYLEAFQWLLIASQQSDSPEILYLLSQCYLQEAESIGIIETEKLGRTHLRLAAEKGWPQAQYDLGVCHELGVKAKEDRAEALYWYEAAAKAGHAEAAAAARRLRAEK